MKRLGITQRIDRIGAHDESRDNLDRRWHGLAAQLGFIVVPLPNLPPAQVPELLDALMLDAVVLSGGNSIAKLDTTAPDASPERDAFEIALLDEILRRNQPVLGVCRGMQFINFYFGGQLARVPDHAGRRHALAPLPDYAERLPTEVNSYHSWGIKSGMLAPDLKAIAHDTEGNIEAFTHKTLPVLGIMWHPERENPFIRKDLSLLGEFLT